ncbi:MAG: hypothetical protein CBC16_03030 [Verrucomicrobia bacterium TMED56]|nr:MAG: hypothetical protein CBC16_03030 [Verrucomicrobia bacterium TMED56]
MKLQNFVALSFSIFSVILVLFLSACGGEEEQGGQSENKQDSNVGGDGMPPSTPAENTPPPVKQDEIATPEKPKAVPSPNGVYLPTGEEKNGKAVYENQEGFSMWNDGVSWKITDRTGGGKVISLGKESINDKWQNGGIARFYPDEEYAKDATFRLAVAFQGSEDNKNAIRLFEQFALDFPDDKLVAEVYLSLGDLSISEVSPDEQPSFEQIANARKNYKMVRIKSDNIGLISDATFNEGGLLERVAENPEGLVNFYYTFDKNKDDSLQKNEFTSAEINASKEFEEYDLNGDNQLDFGELFDLATFESYLDIENLYREYNSQYADTKGARISQATEKVGFACEKQGRPSEMLEMYYKNIEQLGNDPKSVGVDEILKQYTKKYLEYEKLYGSTLNLLKKLQTPDEPVSFAYTNRKGITETHDGTVEEIVKDRRKLLPFLNANFEGMDPKIYSEVARLKGAIFVNPDHAAKFKGYLAKYIDYQNNFPSENSPANAFAKLLQQATDSDQKTLELRMRAALDAVGSRVAGTYNPQISDFADASPGVLVWMAEKMIAQNSLDDAVAAMEQLVDVYGESGGEFLFDANYLLGQAKEKERDYQSAALYFDAALTNSSWHVNSDDARMRRGYSFFEVAKSTKDPTAWEKAISSFEEIRGNTEATLDKRAESSFMMGECRKNQKDHAGAAFLYLETTLNFPSALKWAPKSYEQAIGCYEKGGQGGQVSMIEKQYADWQRKFLK